MAIESTSVASLVPLTSAFRDPFRFCRLCMGGGQLQRLYRAEGEEPVNPELLREIRILVGVEIGCPEDQLSAICLHCVRSLEGFFYFRNRCQAVDVRVRELRAEKVVGTAAPPPPEPKDKDVRDKLGIFGTVEFCRDPADGPEVYRLVREGFVYQHRNLFLWRCEVDGCGCRLDVDKNLGDCRVLDEHDHEVERRDGREIFKMNPEVGVFLNGLSKVVWSTEQVACSSAALESVVNIIEYPQDEDPEKLSEVPFGEVANCTPALEVSFFNCLERGLSMVDGGGYHFLLTQVRSVGGSTWHCTWSSCQVTLQVDSQLIIFKISSEHCHPPPDPSVLLQTTGVSVSRDRVFAELSSSPVNEGQNPQPEVTFYRVAKSVIGVRHDGFCFRLVGFNSEGDSRWKCTWNGCPAQLEISATLHCRLTVSANERAAHDHHRPDGPVCSVVSIISPVKALVELNGKRGVMGRKEKQQNAMNIVEGLPQMQLKLTKVPITARLKNQLASFSNPPLFPTPDGLSFFRYKRSLCLQHDSRHYQLARCDPNGSSTWNCCGLPSRYLTRTAQKCRVTVELDANLTLVSIKSRHRYQSCPADLLNAQTIPPEDVVKELQRRSRLLQFFNGSSSNTTLESDSSYKPSLSNLSSVEY